MDRCWLSLDRIMKVCNYSHMLSQFVFISWRNVDCISLSTFWFLGEIPNSWRLCITCNQPGVGGLFVIPIPLLICLLTFLRGRRSSLRVIKVHTPLLPTRYPPPSVHTQVDTNMPWPLMLSSSVGYYFLPLFVSPLPVNNLVYHWSTQLQQPNFTVKIIHSFSQMYHLHTAFLI